MFSQTSGAPDYNSKVAISTIIDLIFALIAIRIRIVMITAIIIIIITIIVTVVSIILITITIAMIVASCFCYCYYYYLLLILVLLPRLCCDSFGISFSTSNNYWPSGPGIELQGRRDAPTGPASCRRVSGRRS